MRLQTPIFCLFWTLYTRLTNRAKLRLGLKKLDKEGSSASALDKVTRPLLMQPAQPATPSICNNAINASLGQTTDNQNHLQPCALLFQQLRQSPTTSPKQTVAVNLEPSDFSPAPTDVALTFSLIILISDKVDLRTKGRFSNILKYFILLWGLSSHEDKGSKII